MATDALSSDAGGARSPPTMSIVQAFGSPQQRHMAMSLLSSYRLSHPQILDRNSLTHVQAQDLARALQVTWNCFEGMSDEYLIASIRNLKPEAYSFLSWSCQRPSPEQPASAYNSHPFLFPPTPCCLCCSSKAALTMSLLGGSSKAQKDKPRSRYFAYLDGHGAVPCSAYVGSCVNCKSQYFYSYYIDSAERARLYDVTSSRPFLLLSHKMAKSACAFDMLLLKRYRLLLTFGQLTMSAFMETHNAMFEGDDLDKGQISDYTSALMLISFLESMVPISSFDATPLVGRNHRRKEEDGFEPLLLQLIPYIRAVLSRYWSLHFTRTDNPALASVKLYSSHQHPRSYEGMRSMTPREWALHLLPQVNFTARPDVFDTGCEHPSCSIIATVDGHAKVVRDTCSTKFCQVVESPELGNVRLQCPNRPMFKNRRQMPVCASCSISKRANVSESEDSVSPIPQGDSSCTDEIAQEDEPHEANTQDAKSKVATSSDLKVDDSSTVVDADIDILSSKALRYHGIMNGKYFRYPVENVDSSRWPIMKVASVKVELLELLGFMKPVPVICVNYFDPKRRRPRSNFEYTRLEEVERWFSDTPKSIQENGLFVPIATSLQQTECGSLEEKPSSSTASAKPKALLPEDANVRRDLRVAARAISRAQSISEFLGAGAAKSKKSRKATKSKKSRKATAAGELAQDKEVDVQESRGLDFDSDALVKVISTADKRGIDFDEDGEQILEEEENILDLKDLDPEEEVPQLKLMSSFTFDRIISATANPTGSGTRFMVRYCMKHGSQDVMHTADELPTAAIDEWNKSLQASRTGRGVFKFTQADQDDRTYMCPNNLKEKTRLIRQFCETAGIAMMITNCGITVDIYELHGAESTTQVYMNLLDFSETADEAFERFQALMYDNGCNLHAFVARRRKHSRRAYRLSQKEIRVDKLHYRGHSNDPAKVPSTNKRGKIAAAYCRDNCNPYALPITRRENSIVCEQEFRHTAKYKFSLRYMMAGRFCLTLFSVMDERNAKKIASGKFKIAAQKLDQGIKPKVNAGGKAPKRAAATSCIDLQQWDSLVNNPSGSATQNPSMFQEASHTAPPSSTSSQGTKKGSWGRRKRRIVVDEVADGAVDGVVDGVVGPQPFDFLTKCHGGSCSKRCGRGSKEEDK